jgi:hypothetical protein
VSVSPRDSEGGKSLVVIGFAGIAGCFERRKAGIFRVGASIIIKHASWHRKGGGDEEQYHLLDEWWIIT